MASVSVNTKVHCKHCDDEIKGTAISYNSESFCCDGCKMVYQLLSENNLTDYYTIDQKPGLSIKGQVEDDYAYLSNHEIAALLTRAIAPNLHIVYFTIPQIHCSSCIWLLEKLFKINEGIYSSEVDFLKKEVAIRYNPQSITLKGVVELLTKIGYKPKIELGKKKDNSTDPSLITKIGVAGFAFGNIMLFSFPEYLGLETSTFSQWFSILNLILGIPVLFYSGFDYLHQAYYSFKYKTYDINIPLALGMVVMYGVSLYHFISRHGPGYIDSLAGLVFFLLIGKWYQQRSTAFLSFERDYKSYFPITASLFKDGKIHNISIDKIQSGDELIIKNNQIIPVDGTLISAHTMVDYSFVNGEEEAKAVLCGEAIYAGGKLKDKSIKIKANQSVQNSYLVSLWNNAIFRKEDNHKTLTDRLSKYFSLGIIVIATLSFGYWYIMGNTDTGIIAFTSVLIVACPCAIALTTPFINGNLMRLMAKHGIFLRNSQVIDKTANIEHLVFDKTGTITSQLDKDVHYHGKVLTSEEERMIHALTFQSIHPLSSAIEKLLRSDVIYEIKNFQEVEGKGIEGICQGHWIKIGAGAYVNGEATKERETKVYVAIDGKTLGYYLFKNKYREGFEKIVKALHHIGLKTSLLSGDNDKEKETVAMLLGRDSTLLFNQDPHQKMSYINALKKQSKVAMIGDGLNDAGALKSSDLGIVVTDNTNNFTPASDVIFDAGQFTYFDKYFSICKKSILLIAGAYAIAIMYNVVGLYFAVLGQLSPVIAAILMPLSSVSIVIYAVFSSTVLFNKVMRR